MEPIREVIKEMTAKAGDKVVKEAATPFGERVRQAGEKIKEQRK